VMLSTDPFALLNAGISRHKDKIYFFIKASFPFSQRLCQLFQFCHVSRMITSTNYMVRRERAYLDNATKRSTGSLTPRSGERVRARGN
jgi:hypothetical protein